MQDKKEQQETCSQRSLKEVQLDKELADRAFPTRIPEVCKFLEVIEDEVRLCYLAMDMATPTVLLHLYIIPEMKSYETVMKLREVFYTLVHPWCKAQGCNSIVVTCNGSDDKTTELFRTFGFAPENLNMAIMPVQEE